jgi:hypothetical protein
VKLINVLSVLKCPLTALNFNIQKIPSFFANNK